MPAVIPMKRGLRAVGRHHDYPKASILALVLISLAAASQQPFEADRYTAIGGGTSTGGAFAITGAAGQAEAHPQPAASSSVFEIRGGFVAGVDAPDHLFQDGFETR